MNKIHQKFVVPKNKHFNNPNLILPNPILSIPSSISELELPNPIPSSILELPELDKNSALEKYNEFISINSIEKSEIIDDIKKILEKYKEFISSNSLENIREDLQDYKRITDQRIEKLVNLFLSIK